jgi:hypothetical protein
MGVPTLNKKSYLKIEYAYKNGVGYISEMSEILVLPNPIDSSKTLTFSQFYKTYSYETDQIERRPGGRLIFGNSWDPRLIKNRYKEMFWERNSVNEIVTHEMESFPVLDSEENKDYPSSMPYSSSSIRVYGIGFYK